MARYLIPGSAGFIGSKIANILLSEGHSIFGIDNLNDSYDIRMKEWRLDRLKKQPNFEFVKADISDYQNLRSILLDKGPFDAVINMAARAGVRASVENPWVFVETNTTGALNLLEICREMNIKKFILSSSSSVYGMNPPLPTPETADCTKPLQSYAASKIGAEQLCHVYHHLYDIDVTIFRYFTVYGPAGRPEMIMFRINQWIAEGKPIRLNGDGEQTRGFTFLDDIARGTILGLKNVGYEIINLGGHENISMNQLIKKFEEKIGKKAIIEHHPWHPADVRANQADISKARKLLNWEPEFTLEQGIQTMVDWYMQERDWVSQIITQ